MRSESESEQGVKFVVLDPKPSDLAMSWLKVGQHPLEDRTGVC